MSRASCPLFTPAELRFIFWLRGRFEECGALPRIATNRQLQVRSPVVFDFACCFILPLLTSVVFGRVGESS